MQGRAWRGMCGFAIRRSNSCFSTTSACDLPNEVPVLIVGAGPVGMTLSILLNRLGVESLLVERRSEFSQHPQAHFINNRTMEIFRRLDGLGATIQAMQPPLEHWRSFVYCTALDGPILGIVNHIHPEDLISSRSPTNVAHFSQNRLLPIMLENAKKSGISVNTYKPQHSSIFMGYDCTSVQPHADAVLANLRGSQQRSNLVNSEKVVSCKYLVAADGAGSGIRKSMQVNFEGEHNMQQLISVHFSSKKLGKYLVENRPGMLFFVFNPNAIAVIVAHDLRSGEFICQVPYYPPQQKAEDFTEKVCRDTICQLVNIDIDVEIKTVKPWIMHAEVADKYICGEERVILAGDAAHRFPPAGGFGMNTGIQDAHNLAWKLAAVLKGMAHTSLIETYEIERRPIAKANTALSMENFRAAMSIPAALGLDPSYARMAHETINSGVVGSILPKEIQSSLLNSVFSLGRAQVSPLFLNKYNPLAQSRISQVQKILNQGRSLQLQFPAEDLLFRYTDGAVVIEEREDGFTGRRREYIPLSVPGVRLPHMKIKLVHGSPNSDSCSSTLDLIDGKRVEFLLFVENSENGIRWAADAVRLSKSRGIPLRVVIVADESQLTSDKMAVSEVISDKTESEFISDWKSDNADHYIEVMGIDGRKWWETCAVSGPGFVLLVRPDDHIAWRSEKEHDSGCCDELSKVFATVLKLGSDLTLNECVPKQVGIEIKS